MNIGIDATCWWNNRGFGRFTRELLGALFQLDAPHTYYLFTDQPIPSLAALPNVRLVEVRTSRSTTEAAVADSNRSPVDMLRMTRAVAQSPLDLMFFPAVYSWYPVPPRLPSMVTVMDAIAEHFPKLIFPSFRSRFFWGLKMRGALWNCDRVLTISRAAGREIVDYIGVDPRRIDYCSCGANPDFTQIHDREVIAAARRRAGLPEDAGLIVFVGGLAPHKNLLGFIDGFETACRRDGAGGVHLAIVGDFKGAGFHSNHQALVTRVGASSAIRDRVHFAGYVPDGDLVALYSSARAAAMPSFSEGFGLPAIEAMACGAPVLASDRGALPEVVGDGGLYFDPHDPGAIAAAISRMVSDDALHASLAENALARVGQFTWERAARMALAHLEKLVA